MIIAHDSSTTIRYPNISKRTIDNIANSLTKIREGNKIATSDVIYNIISKMIDNEVGLTPNELLEIGETTNLISIVNQLKSRIKSDHPDCSLKKTGKKSSTRYIISRV